MGIRILALVLGTCTAALGVAAAPPPVSPFYARYFLVAGSGDPGLRDGPFLQAAFYRPESVALSKDGNTLYVADQGNHALRAVDLGERNNVKTLCGNGQSGLAEGDRLTARLKRPSQVQAAPDGTALYFLDQDGQALRRFDLKAATTSTLGSVPKGLTLTSLLADNSGLWASGGGALYVWDPRTSLLLPALQDPSLACPQGRLFRVQSGAYYADPCGGHLYRLNGLVGSEADPQSNKPALQALDGVALGPRSVGFSPVQYFDGSWGILCWDPDAATFVRYSPAGGPGLPWPIADQEGIVLPGPSKDLLGPGARSDRRSLLQGPLGMVGAAGGLLFAAQAAGNRLVGFDSRLLYDASGDINLIRALDKRQPGARRLLMLGDSLSYYWRDYGPEMRPNADRTFVRRLETELNLESALKGLPLRYQVLALTKQLGDMSGSAASLYLQLDEPLQNRDYDEVVLIIDGMSFIKELFLFQQNETQDDLATLPFQFEWLEASPQQRHQAYGPLRRGLIEDVRKDPEAFKGWIEFDEKDRLRLLRPEGEVIAHPRIQRFARELFAKALKRCAAKAALKDASVSVVLLPTRDLLEIGEEGGDYHFDHINGAFLDKPLAEAAASQNVPSYCLTPLMRLVALPAYPLIARADHHYTLRGHAWLARFLARQMTGGLTLGVDGNF